MWEQDNPNKLNILKNHYSQHLEKPTQSIYAKEKKKFHTRPINGYSSIIP